MEIRPHPHPPEGTFTPHGHTFKYSRIPTYHTNRFTRRTPLHPNRTLRNTPPAPVVQITDSHEQASRSRTNRTSEPGCQWTPAEDSRPQQKQTGAPRDTGKHRPNINTHRQKKTAQNTESGRSLRTAHPAGPQHTAYSRTHCGNITPSAGMPQKTTQKRTKPQKTTQKHNTRVRKNTH